MMSNLAYRKVGVRSGMPPSEEVIMAGVTEENNHVAAQGASASGWVALFLCAGQGAQVAGAES